jgi:membrane-associated phospholipid phosphatase
MIAKMIKPRIQDYGPHKNRFSDLRAPGLLAKSPVIGLVMVIFGVLAFAGLTYNLFAHGPLLAWDTALANTLPAIGLRSPWFVRYIMAVGFYLGRDVVLVLTILLGFYFLYKRYWQELALVTLGWAGSAIFFFSLSTFIARPRPPTQIWITVDIPGFPSGHAIAVIIFYGLLAYLLAPKMPSAFWKTVVVALALLIIGFVGFSRIFTGGHYLTDILAGYSVGIACFGAIYTLVEMHYQTHKVLR